MKKIKTIIQYPIFLYFLFMTGLVISYSISYPTIFFKCITFCMGINLIIIALALTFQKIKKNYFVKFILFIILFFPCSIYLLHLYFQWFHHVKLRSDHILALLQTNLSEIRQYIYENSFSFFSISILVLMALFITILIIKSTILKTSFKNKSIILFLGVALCFSVDFPQLFSPFNQAIQITKELYQWKKNLNILNKNISGTPVYENDDKIVVVIIGESLNKKHMNAYGYNKDTTPWLSEEIKNTQKGKILLFQNAYSCHTHTVQTLSYSLTEKNSYNDKDLKSSLPIINIAKKLGKYNTWWISNQKKSGLYNSTISFLADYSDHTIWTNDSFSLKDPYDEVIFSHLPSENQIKSGRHLIFIHLMGNHLRYNERYPEKWNQFGKNIINTYDNSILYNDYIIKNIYNHFSKMKNFSLMIYFSDHADSLEDRKFHESALFSWDMTKIPFWIFFSYDYIKKYPDIYSTLKKNQDKPFTNDLIFDTLMGILDIKNTPLYIPENDFSNLKYKYNKSNLATLHGEKPLIEESLNPDIFWLHRTNSPQKLKELGHKYKGLELDIIYHEKENDFENSHDITSLKKFPLTKTLDMYSKLSFKQQLWFDFKNLTHKNAIKAMNRLETILNEHNINKDKVWLESSNIDALEEFTKSGWKTSYYVPYHNLKLLPPNKVDAIKEYIKKISFSQKVKAISFDGQYYSFIKSIKLNPDISLLTWFHTLDINQFMQHPEYKKILMDNQVKVILIKDIGHYHR